MSEPVLVWHAALGVCGIPAPRKLREAELIIGSNERKLKSRGDSNRINLIHSPVSRLPIALSMKLC